MAASFSTQLKNIAITAIKLGKAQAGETLSTLFAQAKESRIGQLYDTVRQRITQTEAVPVKKPRRTSLA